MWLHIPTTHRNTFQRLLIMTQTCHFKHKAWRRRIPSTAGVQVPSRLCLYRACCCRSNKVVFSGNGRVDFNIHTRKCVWAVLFFSSFFLSFLFLFLLFLFFPLRFKQRKEITRSTKTTACTRTLFGDLNMSDCAHTHTHTYIYIYYMYV